MTKRPPTASGRKTTPARTRTTRRRPASYERRVQRRRVPEEAEQEILAAAERFLRVRPFRELQIDTLMDDTGLRRSSFYRYFRDRHDLIVRIIDRFTQLLAVTDATWLASDIDPLAGLRVGFEGIGRFWMEHGAVMRAIADAATHDLQVEKTHRQLLDYVVRAATKRLRTDIARGLIRPLDAAATAKALVMMSEAYLNDQLGRGGRRDWRRAIEPLVTIWQRTLYGKTR